MRKIITILGLLFFFAFITSIIIFSTLGIETKRFNTSITKKINQINNNIEIELTTVRFKLDVKEISLFLETVNPKIHYRETTIPVKNIKVYMDFISLIKSKPKIKKINFISNQINIKQLKKISTSAKPSNFTSFINNKVKKGKLNIEAEVYFNDQNLFDNFIARGSVSNLKAEIIKNTNLSNTSFSFFADKTDVLIKNIFSETGPVKIQDGDIKIILSPEVSLKSNFKSSLKFNNTFTNYSSLFKDTQFIENIVNLEADLNNSFFINFDKTYKVKKYTYEGNGIIKKGNLVFEKPLNNNFLVEKINQLSISNSKFKTSLSSNKNNTIISGRYSLNKGKKLLYNLDQVINKGLLKLDLEAEYDEPIVLDFINYKKSKDIVANLSINLEKQKKNIKIKELNITEGDSLFVIEDLQFNKDKFLSLKKILVKTIQDKKNNNDFSILYGKKISIKGTQFDAINLAKILNKKKSNNIFSKINKDIEIDFSNIIAPLSENLKNFKLIGKIKNGKFTKISAKGDFGENNFLDITMKQDKKNKKKYLEIYSDLTRPLLTEYSFFKGLTGGKLLFSSIIDKNTSNSKLKIENFNVINAPGMVKLLSLADLGGLADLAEGDGLSFDILEISMEKNNDILKLNEILALGPSVSVLMDGYQDPRVTSLRGTLVPAKTLNKMISKIPLLGKIIIPKDVGEGLFGISFKMKGPPGKIKTTINPIRTLTPRFIQKIIDKQKSK
jgi:hypothetical protein